MSFSLFFFDKAQTYENGQDRVFSRSWRDMAPNYILGSLPLRGNACVLIFKICIWFNAPVSKEGRGCFSPAALASEGRSSLEVQKDDKREEDEKRWTR